MQFSLMLILIKMIQFGNRCIVLLYFCSIGLWPFSSENLPFTFSFYSNCVQMCKTVLPPVTQCQGVEDGVVVKTRNGTRPKSYTLGPLSRTHCIILFNPCWIKNDFQIPFMSLRYHLMFSLTGGGKYSFLGTKRWLEENLDHAGQLVWFWDLRVATFWTSWIFLVYLNSVFFPSLQSPACSMTMWHSFCVWTHWLTAMTCTRTCPAPLNLTLPSTLSFKHWRR